MHTNDREDITDDLIKTLVNIYGPRHVFVQHLKFTIALLSCIVHA